MKTGLSECQVCDYNIPNGKNHCFMFTQKPKDSCPKFKIDPEKFYQYTVDQDIKQVEAYR